MDELKQYVEMLFSHQKSSPENLDLKEEIYSNMTAKKNDLIQQGVSELDAISKAEKSIVAIDGLVGNKQLTYINRYNTEKLQTLLLASIVMWILSIPTILVRVELFSFGAFLLVALFGVLFLNNQRKDQKPIAFMDTTSCKKLRKTAWIIWGVFFFVCAAAVSAVLFGSNLWFSRPLNITGPYQFGAAAVRYYLLFITIVFPIVINGFPKIMDKNERNDENE